MDSEPKLIHERTVGAQLEAVEILSDKSSQWEAINGPVKSDKVVDRVNDPGTTVQCNSQWEANNRPVKSDKVVDRMNDP